MTIDQIKQECRKAIELAEKATEGPWKTKPTSSEDQGLLIRGIDKRSEWCCSHQLPSVDVNHIAHARTFAPASARALLENIQRWEVLKEESVSCLAKDFCDDSIAAICAQFEP